MKSMNILNNSIRVMLAVMMIIITSFDLSQAQVLQVTDFAVYSGNGGSGTTWPYSPGYSSVIAPSAIIHGRVGAQKLVNIVGAAEINGDVHAGDKISMTSFGTINGNSSAGNSSGSSSDIFNAGNHSTIDGNLDIAGNVKILGGTVNGTVTIPTGATYNGPPPTGGVVNGNPAIPVLPALPQPATLPAYGSVNITSHGTIGPGAYQDMQLGGQKKLKFDGPGVYTFRKIKNTGKSNEFQFDFQNDPTGVFIIYVHEDIDVNKVKTTFKNGGSADRIYFETHGNGSSSPTGVDAFTMANGWTWQNQISSWKGTVYAPFAGINLGKGSGLSDLTGAFWSSTRVFVNTGVTMYFDPFSSCTVPNVNAGADMSIDCINNTVVLNGSSSSPNPQFSWTALNGGNIVSGANTATPTVNAAGMYVLTVSTGSTCNASDTALVTSSVLAPNADAGADGELTCLVDSLVLNGTSSTIGAQFAWTASNGGNIVSGNNTANPTVDAAGTYTLTVTDPANGCTASDDVIVTLDNDVPDADAGADSELTCLVTSLILNGTSSTAGAQFAWTASNGGNIVSGNNTPNPTVDAAGTYTLTVTDPANGCTASDVMIVTLDNDVPDADAGADSELTCLVDSLVLNGTSSTVGAQFAWTASNGGNIVSGNNTPNPTVDAAGTYTLTVTDPANGCMASDDVIVTLDNDVPDADAGNDGELTCLTTSLILNGSSSTAGAQFAWTASNGGNIVSGNNTANPTVDAAGTYTLTVTDPANGCTTSDDVIVTLNNTPPNADAGNDDELTCLVTSLILNGSSSTAGAQFAWTASSGGNIVSGNNTANPTIDAAGTYTLTVTDPANGCTATDEVNVTINDAHPEIDAGFDRVITCLDPIVELIGSSSVAQVSYLWTATNGGNIVSGANSSSAFANAAGTYILNVTDTINGCASSDTVEVIMNVQNPVADAGTPDAINCIILQVDLDGSGSSAGVSYNWTSQDGNILSGAQTANPNVNETGTYYLTVTDTANGCSSTDSVSVFEGPCILPYYPPDSTGKIESNLGSELTSLYLNYVSGNDSANNIFFFENDSVWIEIITIDGYTQDVFNIVYQTQNFGLSDTIPNGLNPLIITGRYPIANLPNLDSIPLDTLINYVRPVYPAITSSGVVQTQGDLAQGSNTARNGFQINGSGIKVCVTSDSYNTVLGDPAGTDILNGDLPGTGSPLFTNPVHVIKEYPFGRRTDEGRAMLQIVHDIAPGADLGFRTGTISEGDLASGILQMANAGCDVIVDDVTYLTSPFFQDGVIAKAVEQVSAMGITYVVAAGNFNSNSYTNAYNPMPAPDGFTGTVHDFGGSDHLMSVTLDPGVYTIVLQWQDSIYSLGQTSTGTVNDFDIYLTNEYGTTYFGFNKNNIGGDPFEVLPFVVPGNSPVNANLMIVRAEGTQAADVKFVAFRGDITFNEHATGTSTIVGQANAESALTTGAVNYFNTPAFGVNPPQVTNFSSRGGTLVDGVVRSKPDFVAPNGVNTTVDLGGPNYEGDLFPNFFGTSAAAPHVAGAVALLRSARKEFYNQDMTPAELKSLLQSTAIDIEAPGFDFATGAGYIQVDSAMYTFAAPVPLLTSLILSDTSLIPGSDTITVITDGNFFTTSSVIIFDGDTLATTFISPTQLTAVVPPFSGNKGVYVYTPPISPSTNDGGVSDTLYFFSTLKKNISIIADNKYKKFGEELPAFTATILVDSVPLAASGLTFADLGLDSIVFNSPGTASSNSGIYFIQPSANVTDPSFNDFFNYDFINGLLIIEQMPLDITPRDTTIEYGAEIDGLLMHFNYSYDDSNIPLADQAAYLQGIKTGHKSTMIEAVALVEDTVLINNRAIASADLVNLAFMVSRRTAIDQRAVVSQRQRAVVSGFDFDTTKVIDLSPESIFEFQIDPDSAQLYEAGPIISAARSQRAVVSQSAVVSARAFVDQRAVVSGSSLLNSSSTGDSSMADIVIIFDEDDADAPPNDTIEIFYSVNLITGLNVGTHFIAPGAFLTNNFEMSHGVGILTIGPAPLDITPDDVSIPYGSEPIFSYTVSNYQYDDSTKNILVGSPVYTITDTLGNPVTDSVLPVGVYDIHISGLSQTSPASYTLVYHTGRLTVHDVVLTVTADRKCIFVFQSIPNLTSTITGWVPGGNDYIVSGPQYTITPSTYYPGPYNAPGEYTITPSNLVLNNPNNYTINYVPGKLYVNPYGWFAQKVQVWLMCIEPVINGPGGLSYKARFQYRNNNSTPVCIEQGVHNNLSGNGSFEGSIPEIFLPGTHNVDIYFDGTPLYWSVNSFHWWFFINQTAMASSSSNICWYVARTAGNSSEEFSDEELVSVFPNPTDGKLSLTLSEGSGVIRDVQIFDMLGKQHNINGNLIFNNSNLELDMSEIDAGMYVIRVTTSTKEHMVRVIKN